MEKKNRHILPLVTAAAVLVIGLSLLVYFTAPQRAPDTLAAGSSAGMVPDEATNGLPASEPAAKDDDMLVFAVNTTDPLFAETIFYITLPASDVPSVPAETGDSFESQLREAAIIYYRHEAEANGYEETHGIVPDSYTRNMDIRITEIDALPPDIPM